MNNLFRICHSNKMDHNNSATDYLIDNAQFGDIDPDNDLTGNSNVLIEEYPEIRFEGAIFKDSTTDYLTDNAQLEDVDLGNDLTGKSNIQSEKSASTQSEKSANTQLEGSDFDDSDITNSVSNCKADIS